MQAPGIESSSCALKYILLLDISVRYRCITFSPAGVPRVAVQRPTRLRKDPMCTTNNNAPHAPAHSPTFRIPACYESSGNHNPCAHAKAH